MNSKKKYNQKNTPKIIDAAAEQWVNLVLTQIIYQKPSYGFIHPDKKNNYEK